MCLEWWFSLAGYQHFFLFGMEEEGDDFEHRHGEGGGEADVNIRRFVHPNVPDLVPDGEDWPGKEYGLSPTEYENLVLS
jgi:hypothetical protein